MRYLHILSAFAAEPWAMQPEKLATITAFLLFQAEGGKFNAEEIQARIGERRAGEAAKAPGGIAVLPMQGVISQRAGMMSEISGGVSTEALAGAFRAAIADDSIRAVVFDVDSPGGGTYGVDEFASEIRAARGVKPIVAQVNSMCASAAYYLASQADEVVVTPGGEAGSIGVYTVHQDVSKALEKAGVNATLIKGSNGVHKAETNSLGPLSKDSLAYVQARVDAAEDKFISAVALGRRTSEANVRANFGKGRMFDADAAVKAGLADRVGSMRETLQRLGAAQPRYGATAQSRQAFAAGGNPELSQIEDVLRDAGFSKALAASFVSLGKGALRSESGPIETSDRPLSPDAKASLAAFMARLSS